MAKYAEGTTVTVGRSKDEIETMIRTKGGINFRSGTEEDADVPFAWIQFKMRGYVLRFILALPSVTDRDYTHDSRGYRRTPAQAQAAYAAEEKRRWRELVLLLKSKLVTLESGLVKFEEEFLAYIVLDDDVRVGDKVIPMLAEHRGLPQLPPARNEVDEK